MSYHLELTDRSIRKPDQVYIQRDDSSGIDAPCLYAARFFASALYTTGFFRSAAYTVGGFCSAPCLARLS
jgi:hypothetical protein